MQMPDPTTAHAIGRAPETPSGATTPFFEGRVEAGFPSPADDYMDRPLDLHEQLVPRPAATFFVRAQGDSMVGAGIHDGDLLVVDRSLAPVPGRVVIAALDGELTIKRLGRGPDGLRLEAENDAYPVIEIGEDTDARIWGVVTSVIHAV
jgi:DNA polymerase V